MLTAMLRRRIWLRALREASDKLVRAREALKDEEGSRERQGEEGVRSTL